MPPSSNLATHIVARRRERGLAPVDAAQLAGVTRQAWSAWEHGTMPSDKNWTAIERALEWGKGSIVKILAGGEPTLLSGSAATTAPGETDAVGDASDMRGLPAAIRAALSQGEHLAGDIIDLTRPGSGFRLIVVAQRGLYRTPEDIESLREQMEEWIRLQTGIRELAARQPQKEEPETDDDGD